MKQLQAALMATTAAIAGMFGIGRKVQRDLMGQPARAPELNDQSDRRQLREQGKRVKQHTHDCLPGLEIEARCLKEYEQFRRARLVNTYIKGLGFFRNYQDFKKHWLDLPNAA